MKIELKIGGTEIATIKCRLEWNSGGAVEKRAAGISTELQLVQKKGLWWYLV